MKVKVFFKSIVCFFLQPLNKGQSINPHNCDSRKHFPPYILCNENCFYFSISETQRLCFIDYVFLSNSDTEIMMSKCEIHSGSYHLVASNLRNLANLEAKLSACGLDHGLPTLFISECVLVYIETEYTDKLIKWIADSFPTAFFVNYEQVCKPVWLFSLGRSSIWYKRKLIVMLCSLWFMTQIKNHSTFICYLKKNIDPHCL